MSQTGSALAHLSAMGLYLCVSVVYVPVLLFLGVPAQVALTVTAIGTLCVIAAGVAWLFSH